MDLKDYFQSYEDYFWQWENEILSADSVFETLVIPGGNTIAYEQFVMETLELLSLDGFPPFGSFLLTIIATNPNAKESLIKVFEIINQRKTVQKASEYPKGFRYARNFLQTLTDLPSEFREGDRRKQLLQVIFKDCHNRVADSSAKAIMQHYNLHKHLLADCSKKIPLSETNLKKDIQTLAHLHIKYGSPGSVLAAISGIPDLPELNENVGEQQPASASRGNFTNQLINDPETFAVGSLIHRIWGGLNIPLHHSTPSVQPLGGVSDLTNKGDFDKLLISEFANDDQVFMSRIANNEALYIKREVPPESDKFVRFLLIDCSLKNWGTPKILAFASALAIAKHPKTDIECRIFALGSSYTAVAADTVTDVINGLSNLGAQLDAATGLRQFLHDHSESRHSEIFLISSSNALASAEMQRVLSDHYDMVKYIIAAENQGELRFYRIRNRGRKLVQHIKLPLEELWRQKPLDRSAKQKSSVVKGETSPSQIYPVLMLPPKTRLAVFAMHSDEFYMLSGSGQLFRTCAALPENEGQFFRIHKGAELILQNLSISPHGKYALQTDENDEYLLAAFYPKEMYASILNLNTREFHKKKILLSGNADDYSVVEHNGFYLFNEAASQYFKLHVNADQLQVEPVGRIKNLEKKYLADRNRIALFEKGCINYSIMLNVMPVCVSNQNQLQFRKYLLQFNTNHSSYENIQFVGNRHRFKPAIYAAYDKAGKRFVFPDGSTISRDGLGMLIFRSSNDNIPTIFLPSAFNVHLAMATATHFAGNKNFLKEEAGQKVISIADFDMEYFQPFINTILTHGT